MFNNPEKTNWNTNETIYKQKEDIDNEKQR